MAKISKGILGGFSGRVGNVVGSKIFGIDVMRSYQPNVANPRTPGQVTQRTKFSLVVLFLRQFLDILKIGFKMRAINMSAFNACVAANLKTAVIGEFPDFNIDLPNLAISRGPLLSAIGQRLSEVAEGNYQLRFDSNVNAGDIRETDTVHALYYNKTKNLFFQTAGNETRVDLVVNINPPDGWLENDEIHAWLFFESADKSQVSDSFYCGTGIMTD